MEKIIKTLLLTILLSSSCFAARLLNGVDQVFVTTNVTTTDLNRSSGCTMMCWIKLTAVDGVNNRCLFSYATSGANGLHTRIRSDRTMQCYLNDGSPANCQTGILEWVAGTWYHIAITYRAGESLQIYRNGVSTGTIAASATLPTDAGRNQVLSVGSFNYNGNNGNNTFNGVIDDIKIWNYQLSANQVRNEINYRFPMAPNCLVYFPLNENLIFTSTSTYATDYSGHGYKQASDSTASATYAMPSMANGYQQMLSIIP